MKTLEDYNKAINKAYKKYVDLTQAKLDFIKSRNISYNGKYIKVTLKNDPSFIMYVTNVTCDSVDGADCLKGPKLYLNGNRYDKDAVFYPEDWIEAKIEVITKEEYLELFHKTITNIEKESNSEEEI